MSILLSEEQQEVVTSKHNQFVVRAAAGSGKTRILVERYLKHVIDEGISPDQILTITFTKKAAAEMKGRIVEALMQRARFAEAQVAETGPIQTIHSFCEKILRESALLAGLDPQFKILSEAQSTEIYDFALEKVLEAKEDHTDEIKQLIKDLSGKFEYYSPLTLHAKLSSGVSNVLGAFRGSGLTVEALWEIYKNPNSLELFWKKQIDSDLAEKSDTDDLENWLVKFAESLKAQSLKLPSWLKSKPEKLNNLSLLHSCGLMQLSLKVWEQMNLRMEELQAFDFCELEARAVQLIKGSESIAARFKKRYQVLMIDESQDVNPLQYQLIDSLSVPKEMMVGDPQQSIYGFRHADLRLFVSRSEERSCLGLSKNYRTSPGVLRFVDEMFGKIWTDSYRSMGEKQTEEDSDDLFGSVMPEINYEGVEFWPQMKKDHALSAYWIKQLIEEGHEPREVAVLVRTTNSATQIGQQLKGFGIPYQISGGAEKFYARLEVRDLANALIALADPWNDYAMLAMLYSPIVGLSLDSIVMLASEKPIFEALKSFEPLIECDKRKLQHFAFWFSELSDNAERMAAWEVIAKIFEASPFLVELAKRHDGMQKIANVRKVLRLAAEEPELGPMAFAGRIRNIQEIYHREGDAPALDENANYVSLMTVHKSKGLEFPVVVLADMHQKFNRRIRDVVSDPRSGLMFTKFSQEQSIFHDWLTQQNGVLDRQEELRVLYVAMTRAKSNLCVVVQPSAVATCPAGMIAQSFGFKDPSVENHLGIKVRKI